jgi:glycosyltransferase involved in cell wall biosynthesis
LKIFLCKGSFFGPVSGADQMLVNYALHLKAAGHDPQVVITVPFASDDQYLVRLRAVGVPVVSLGTLGHYLRQRMLRKVANFVPAMEGYRDWEEAVLRTAIWYLKRERPDVLHVIAEGGVYIRAGHAAGIPVIQQEPAMPFYGDAAEVQVSYQKLSAALPLASELVAVSPRIAQLCRERLNCPDRVSVVPILVDDPATGHEAGTPRGGVTFGFAARIEALKGPMVLLEAFARILPEVPQARLIIAGSGDQEAEIKQRAVELGLGDRCEFPGPYTDEAGKRAFLEKIDVLVHPSLFEGTPCTVIEAMAYRLPVIASEVGGVPDMLTPEVGSLVPPGEVDALAVALLELAGDEPRRRQMGLAARVRYLKLFAPAAVLPLLLEKYNGAIGRTHGGAEVEHSSAHPWAVFEA